MVERAESVAEADLQWSRNFRAAERRIRSGSSHRTRPFNGAATLGLRKALLNRCPHPAPSLQWSRNFRAAESLDRIEIVDTVQVLQWSRNFRAAESRTRGRRRRPRLPSMEPQL